MLLGLGKFQQVFHKTICFNMNVTPSLQHSHLARNGRIACTKIDIMVSKHCRCGKQRGAQTTKEARSAKATNTRSIMFDWMTFLWVCSFVGARFKVPSVVVEKYKHFEPG